jgi:hypothetical protein
MAIRSMADVIMKMTIAAASAHADLANRKS